MRSALTLVLAAMTLGAVSANAATIKFRFVTTGDFSDNNFALSNRTKEDNWTSDSDRAIRGAKYEIRVGGRVISSGHLGDGVTTGDTGCTPEITLSNVNVTYDWKVWAETVVQGNTIHGENGDDGNSNCFRSSSFTNTGGSGTYEIHFHGVSDECNDVWRAVNAASYAIYRHAGGMKGKTYVVRVDSSASNSTSATTVSLTHHRRKFTMVHEMGHALASAKDGDLLRGGHCGDDDSACPSDASQGSSTAHAMGSRENQVCAFQEAFAHFYAADVFNSHNQQNCVFRYYKNYEQNPGFGKPTVDCEAASDAQNFSVVDGPDSPSSVYRVAYMENKPCSSPLTGRGVEVDWLRVLWDVHTNGDGVSFTRMLNWMADAIDVWDDDIFGELNRTANDARGTLKANWNVASDFYGINH